MTQYILFFILVIILSQFLKNNNHGNAVFLSLSIGIMWLMIGFRPIYIGSDTASYSETFQKILTLNTKGSREPLFFISTYLIRLLTDNLHVYFLIMESVYCVALFHIMKKYLNNPNESLIAVTLLYLLGFYAFSVAGLRQTIAIGFIILAFIAADNKKWLYYVLCVALAFGFHNTALIALAIPLFTRISIRKVAIPLILAMVIVANYMPANIIDFMSSEDSFVGERYGNYGTIYESSQNYTGFFLQLIIVALAHIRYNYINLNTETKKLFFNMAYIGLGFQAMTVVVAEFFRVSFYFCIFDIVLAPLALSTFTKNKGTIYTLFIIGCLLYIFVLAQGSVIPMTK